jgi:HK97 family phage prohead protease
MRSMRGLHVIRGGAGTPTLSSRSTRANGDGTETGDGRLGTLVVDFSRFGTWYEIDSFWEGQFLERVQRGSFKKTMAERGPQVKVLFNHGFDMFLDNKALSVPEVLEEREQFAHLEGPLFRGTPELIVEGLRAGAYGSSFMFEVLGETWEREPEKSDHNPEGIPERTITEVRLFEAGPVTWPANPDATAGLRSGMDWYAEQVAKRDRDQYDELLRSFAAFRALHGLGTPSGAVSSDKPKPETPASDIGSDRHVDGSAASRRQRLEQLQAVDISGTRRKVPSH